MQELRFKHKYLTQAIIIQILSLVMTFIAFSLGFRLVPRNPANIFFFVIAVVFASYSFYGIPLIIYSLFSQNEIVLNKSSITAPKNFNNAVFFPSKTNELITIDFIDIKRIRWWPSAYRVQPRLEIESTKGDLILHSTFLKESELLETRNYIFKYLGYDYSGISNLDGQIYEP